MKKIGKEKEDWNGREIITKETERSLDGNIECIMPVILLDTKKTKKNQM